MIALIGSGETSPTMVGLHRDVVAGLGPGLRTAVLLETPYGFQENAEDISARAQAYFARSVGLQVAVPPGLRGRDLDGIDADQGLAALRAADWVFAGPGSPSYALTRWHGGAVGASLCDHARAGTAAIVFASAAACTLGRWAIPVYEIYKAGAPPRWLDGLDVLGGYGLKAAVIPHYDNAEGGNHDTRYCYLGERRLRLLEQRLPADASVLGIDEHTAAVIDPDADDVRVSGRGSVTIRRHGDNTVVPAGETMTLSELRSLTAGAPGRRRPRLEVKEAASIPATTTLRDIVLDRERRFGSAIAKGDATAMVRAVLDIDTAVTQWAADTEEDIGTDWARDVLRSLIARLGQAAARGLRDPRDALAPAMEPLLVVRAELRRSRLYRLADSIRDALTAAGVEIRDTPLGPRWRYTEHADASPAAIAPIAGPELPRGDEHG